MRSHRRRAFDLQPQTGDPECGDERRAEAADGVIVGALAERFRHALHDLEDQQNETEDGEEEQRHGPIEDATHGRAPCRKLPRDASAVTRV